MATVTLKVPQKLERDLARASKARGISRSELLRRAAVAYIAEPKPKGFVSALDKAGDLVGCFKGSPDLATNPKYMEGFGDERWKR